MMATFSMVCFEAQTSSSHMSLALLLAPSLTAQAMCGKPIRQLNDVQQAFCTKKALPKSYQYFFAH